MDPKVGCFAGFCDHRLMTMSVHTHVYAILCMKVEWRQVWEWSLYAEKKECYQVNTNNNNKIDFLTVIIGMLCAMAIL